MSVEQKSRPAKEDEELNRKLAEAAKQTDAKDASQSERHRSASESRRQREELFDSNVNYVDFSAALKALIQAMAELGAAASAPVQSATLDAAAKIPPGLPVGIHEGLMKLRECAALAPSKARLLEVANKLAQAVQVFRKQAHGHASMENCANLLAAVSARALERAGGLPK